MHRKSAEHGMESHESAYEAALRALAINLMSTYCGVLELCSKG